jgi:N-acetylglucosaminyldiphosphoundecaprenol N-acetyl-beta-D-mannosaminyltransferase
LYEAVTGSDLVLADGMAVVWAGKILRQPLPARVAGIDLFERLLGLAHKQRWRVYFLGASQPVLDEVLLRVRRRYPCLRIAGSHNGYFGPSEQEAIAASIRGSRADLLFVAMTSPKKEFFLGRFGGQLDVAVCHGVGGSFDVLAGKVRRAPPLWQALGLEWLYRVIQEPRRMWKRYLVTNVQFAGLLLREALGGGARAGAAPPARPGAGCLLHAGRPPERAALQLARLAESAQGWRIGLLPQVVDELSRFWEWIHGRGQPVAGEPVLMGWRMQHLPPCRIVAGRMGLAAANYCQGYSPACPLWRQHQRRAIPIEEATGGAETVLTSRAGG